MSICMLSVYHPFNLSEIILAFWTWLSTKAFKSLHFGNSKTVSTCIYILLSSTSYSILWCYYIFYVYYSVWYAHCVKRSFVLFRHSDNTRVRDQWWINGQPSNEGLPTKSQLRWCVHIIPVFGADVYFVNLQGRRRHKWRSDDGRR